MEIKKTAIALIIGLVTTLSAFGQQEVLKAINDIKRTATTEGYLTEEKMVPVRDDNTVEYCAKSILRQLGGGYKLQDIKPYLHELVMKRGSRQLVFVYLKKSELGAPSECNAASDAQVKIKPRFDIDSNGRIAHNRPKENHVPTNTAATTHKRTNASHSTEASSWSNINVEGRLKSITKDIMLYKNAESVKRCLEYMIVQGRITSCGLYGQSDNLDQQYVVLFKSTPPYAPFAVLSPVNNGIRQNLETKEPDSVDRHEGCGLMWFTIK